jgi:hypothetical protein
MSQGIAVTPCTSIDEEMAALDVISHYFGARSTREDAERWGRIHHVGRMLAAKENGAIVGGTGAFDFELTVLGGMVRAAGVTVVRVQPIRCSCDERKRGTSTPIKPALTIPDTMHMPRKAHPGRFRPRRRPCYPPRASR